MKTRPFSLLPWLSLPLFLLTGCPKTVVVKKDPIAVRRVEPVRTAKMDYQDAMSTYQQGKSSGKVDYKTVTTYLKKALARKPNLTQARFNLGAIYEEMGRYKLADQQFGAILQNNERHKEALYRLAQVKVRQKLHGDALRLFLRYLELDPKRKNEPRMLTNLAALQIETGNHEGALTTARRILAYDSKSIEAYRLLARVYLKQRKYPVVHLVFQLAKKLNKKDAKLLNISGLAYLGQKKFPQALITFTEATRLDPNLFAAQMNLGLLALNYYDYGRALMAFTQAARLEPHNKDALVSHAIALRANKKYKQAEEIYTKQILTRFRNDPNSLFNLSLLYLRYLKKPRKAKQTLRRFIGEMGARINEGHPAYKMMKEADQSIKMQEYMKKQEEEAKRQANKKRKAPPARR